MNDKPRNKPAQLTGKLRQDAPPPEEITSIHGEMLLYDGEPKKNKIHPPETTASSNLLAMINDRQFRTESRVCVLRSGVRSGLTHTQIQAGRLGSTRFLSHLVGSFLLHVFMLFSPLIPGSFRFSSLVCSGTGSIHGVVSFSAQARSPEGASHTICQTAFGKWQADLASDSLNFA